MVTFLCGHLCLHFQNVQLLSEYDHGKIVNECKCSCSAGVESVDGVTVLGKLPNEDWLVMRVFSTKQLAETVISLCGQFYICQRHIAW